MVNILKLVPVYNSQCQLCSQIKHLNNNAVSISLDYYTLLLTPKHCISIEKKHENTKTLKRTLHCVIGL